MELDDTHPDLAIKVHQGFEGFKALLKRLLEEAIELGELPNDLNSTTVTEMLFTGMLGSCSIDSLIEYLLMLSNKNVINHTQKEIPLGIQEDCFDDLGEQTS